MREPADDGPRGRGLVGWSALLVASAGLLHLGKNQPTEAAVLDRAGGWLGRGVGCGLAAAVTPYVAITLLILLAIFGLLVVTATPINKIPARLLAFWRYLVGAPTRSTMEGEICSTRRMTGLPALRRGRIRGGARACFARRRRGLRGAAARGASWSSGGRWRFRRRGPCRCCVAPPRHRSTSPHRPRAAAHARPDGGRLPAPADQPAAPGGVAAGPQPGQRRGHHRRCAECSISSMWTPP